VENHNPIIIRLKKSFPWQSSYHKYPFYLAEADPNKTYTKKQVYTEIFRTGSVPTSSNKHDWVSASFGVDVDNENKEVTINGIGLIEKINADQYRISEAAVELGRNYGSDPVGKGWRIILGEVVARNDVRTRVVLYHLGILGYCLYFPDDSTYNGFGTTMKHAQLISRGDVVNFLVQFPLDQQISNTRAQVFNFLLDRYRYEVLGPFLSHKIQEFGLDLTMGIEYRGGKISSGKGERKIEEPSTNKLGVYLKLSLVLFVDLEVLVFNPVRKAWIIDYSRAKALFSPELVADLFVDYREEKFEKLLQTIYFELSDAEGYAHIRTLRDKVCENLDISYGQRASYFNRQVARLLSEGRLTVGKTMGWHSSANDALFGDRSKEYVQFLF
jgi:hypothetical protein